LANLCETFLGSNIGQNLDEVGIIAERIQGGLETVDGKDLLSLGEKDSDVASSDAAYSSYESCYHCSCFFVLFFSFDQIRIVMNKERRLQSRQNSISSTVFCFFFE